MPNCQAQDSRAFTRAKRCAVPIYTLKDQLDFVACQELLQAIQRDIDDGARAIAVDLKRLPTLESSAAWLLVTVQLFLRKRRGRLLMLDPQPQVGMALARAWTAVSGSSCRG